MTSAILATLFPDHFPVALLQSTRISDVAIPKQIITIIPTGTTVSSVLETFSRANIVSAPVISEDSKLVGFADVLDIVALFEHCKRNGEPIDKFFSTHIEKAMELPMSLEVPALKGVPRHPVIALPHTTTMAHLLQRLTVGEVHRVAMTTDGKITAIITQRDVLRWIVRHAKSFEHPALINNTTKTLAELGFGGPSDRQVITCTEGTFAGQAFAKIRDYNLTCLPVVDDKGVLQHVLSASDLRSLSTSNIDLLDQPVHLFLAKRPESTLVTAMGDTTLGEVLRRLNDSGKHRVVVVNKEQKPTGIVSLSDIIPLFAQMAKQQ